MCGSDFPTPLHLHAALKFFSPGKPAVSLTVQAKSPDFPTARFVRLHLCSDLQLWKPDSQI